MCAKMDEGKVMTQQMDDPQSDGSAGTISKRTSSSTASSHEGHMDESARFLENAYKTQKAEEDRVQKLKSDRAELMKAGKRLTADIRNANKRKKRLHHHARRLTQADLFELYQWRSTSAEKRQRTTETTSEAVE